MRITSLHVLPITAPVTGEAPRADVRVVVADEGKQHEQAP